MTLYEPFNVEHWFINVFSGNTDIFLMVSLLAITSLCAMFRMQMSSLLVMLVIFAAIVGEVTSSAFMVLLILILAPIFFWITRRITE